MAQSPDRGLVLSPDPTSLTNEMVEKATQTLLRDLAHARESAAQQTTAVQQLLTLRMDAMDTATRLLERWRDTLPEQLDNAMMQAHRTITERFLRVDERFVTMTEKFASNDKQFAERDTRALQAYEANRLFTEQAASSTKLAIDAALQAQKEAVAAQNTNIAQALARIEQTAQRQIEQLVTLLQTTAGAQNDKVDDIKERVTLIEGRTAGLTAARSTQREVITTQLSQGSNIQGIIGIGLNALAILVTISLAIMMALQRP